jgi:hypothetical protein
MGREQKEFTGMGIRDNDIFFVAVINMSKKAWLRVWT